MEVKYGENRSGAGVARARVYRPRLSGLLVSAFATRAMRDIARVRIGHIGPLAGAGRLVSRSG